ncbi:MAG: SPBc2 prophage-derived endonuclease YokF precursor [Chloroflexi bacterium ADurb.Bin325]|nr:MAG: SPBc2 prophage-derived endonuclease YokF precursor [Chloroflexi bacterium ADurb.Bin325]
MAELVKVVDGDTIDVRIDGAVERVRYIGVDTPERNQPGYQAATAANRALLGAGPLYLVRDVSERDRMASPRLLRYVYLADGTHVNAALVAGGWAQPVEYPPDVRHAAELRALAVTAAREGRGFWAAEPPADGAMSYGLTLAAAHIRRGPGNDFAVTATLPPDTPLTVFGRTAAGDWLQVRAPDRTGGWLAAGLARLNVAVEAAPVVANIPAPAEAAAEPAQAPMDAPRPLALLSAGGLQGITLVVVKNDGREELLELRNGGPAAVDVGGWVLWGSKGDERCVLPGRTVLEPGAAFQVATGDSELTGEGYKCAARPIWNNDGETIYLRTPAGEQLQIEATRVR